MLESPYNNMVDQIKASRRSKWFSLKTLTLFDCVPCTLIEMLASWNTYLGFAGGMSDLSWSIWSGWTSWTWNFGEQFEPDKGNWNTRATDFKCARCFRILGPFYFKSAEIQRSDHWLPSVECPVLILHAADDVKVNHAKCSLYFSICHDKRHFKFDIFSTSLSHSGAARAQQATLWGDGIIKYCSALWVMITQRWSDDHSKVKKKKDVSRVLLDKDFGFGHHLAHYQVICNISCPITDDLQCKIHFIGWKQKGSTKSGLALHRTHHSCCRVWWGWSTSSGTRSSQVGSAWTSLATRT